MVKRDVGNYGNVEVMQESEEKMNREVDGVSVTEQCAPVVTTDGKKDYCLGLEKFFWAGGAVWHMAIAPYDAGCLKQ